MSESVSQEIIDDLYELGYSDARSGRVSSIAIPSLSRPPTSSGAEYKSYMKGLMDGEGDQEVQNAEIRAYWGDD